MVWLGGGITVVSRVVVVVVVAVGAGSSVTQEVRNAAATAARIEPRIVIFFIA